MHFINTKDGSFITMKKAIVWMLLLLLALASFQTGASALVEEKVCLNKAFSMLEEGNVFLRKYNEITGAGVKPVFELGMPYYFGGQDSKRVLAQAPLYGKVTVRPDVGGTKYFRVGQTFLMGFDCSGFTKWICRESGMNEFGEKGHPGLQDLLMKDVYKNNNHIFSGGTKAVKLKAKPMPAYEELQYTLQPGDFLVAKHPGARHIMMYIGTLNDFGFTPDELPPQLANYMEYPLVIHCGPSPVAGERFQAFIDSNRDYKNCNTTNGCVEVSIVGVPVEEATHHVKNLQKKDYDYFMIDNRTYALTIFDLSVCTSFAWFRVHTV